MRKTTSFIPFSTLLLLTGCAVPIATPYQAIKNNEGYVSRQISSGEYEIQVRGNRVTTRPTLVNHFNRRAKELCGHDHFEGEIFQKSYTHITEGKTTSFSVSGIPIYHHTPETMSDLPYVSGTVRCSP